MPGFGLVEYKRRKHRRVARLSEEERQELLERDAAMRWEAMQRPDPPSRVGSVLSSGWAPGSMVRVAGFHVQADEDGMVRVAGLRPAPVILVGRGFHGDDRTETILEAG